MTKRKVILRKCETYDVDTLSGIIREGMEELGEKPRGRILIKPNIVTANKDYIHHSFTAPPVMEAMVNVLRQACDPETITMGESGGIGLPTRMFFSESDYYKLAKRLEIPLVDFNEEQTREVSLHRAKLHKTLLLAKSLYEADYKIWMPKLKFHIVTDFTNALKLNIGITTHKERFLYHDDRLHEKIVDLLEIGYPHLIVTDAVTIGKGFESSPYPEHLGAIIISNDPVASDVVASHIMNYNPEKVRFLMEARDRGYGSLSLNDMEISGDITIDELAERTRPIYSPFQNLNELETPIRFYEGINKRSGNACYGGCVCSIKGVLGTAEKKFDGNLKQAKKGAIVMGYYEGDVIHPDEPVALIGTCAGVSGKLEAGKIIHIKGCPVKVADLMFWMLPRFNLKSPAGDLRNLALLIYFSIVKLWMQITIPFRSKAKIRTEKQVETIHRCSRKPDPAGYGKTVLP
ncbi:MAG: DUF362 domain-containing protein [Desulfobacteraceae bacterium]|nr:MAG: DUF362 domain-containing protein [Desulfobacteraceae bacterium]